ncbi:nuclear-interacting partner of ALK isoform X1 [Anguilla rostrata]|uniref:nuclear-interacting partner of ALK isoform X1 n=1 Tax=Anguilla rostrata TaxID=7938 RepID=UPI0030CDFBC8
MATFGGCGNNRVDNFDGKNKSPLVTPQKVRELLNEGVVSEERRRHCVEQEAEPVNPNGLGAVPCEAVSKEAFFSRVESYSCLKWAGKPAVLSPLRCARYGWINIDCDMLKCSSCQAFLCASLQASQDIEKYEGRILELTKLLQTQHEKFCFWPDFPCPDRFWMVPVNEPGVLLAAFLERFKSSCLLELQLPAMKPEHLKSMSLTEEVMGILLQLIEEELRKEGRSPAKLLTEPLSIQVAACIVALCGWAASPTLNSLHLPVLTCSYCQRKVGLWSFHQIEGMVGDGDESFSTPSTPGPGPEGRADRITPSSPTPCRMKLRSQDSGRPEQPETCPSPVARTRSRDSPSPSEEPPSPLLRGKRPMTRSRGQGEAPGGEVPSSPQRKAKRPRLSSTGSPEGPMHRNVFDPVAQHRDWCPWVSTGRGDMHREAPPTDPQAPPPDTDDPQPGWKASLSLFLSTKKCLSPTGSSPSQGLHDKSKRVFKIFRQWQVSSSQ